jgi:HPt (histidine-containing phosphotransfer) domain-containing protein
MKATIMQSYSKTIEDQIINVCPIDWTSVMNICGDENIVREIAKAILEDDSATVKFIADAVEHNETDNVQLYAHKLKGSAMTIGAHCMKEAAYKLEMAGKEKDTGSFDSLYKDVKKQFETLASFLSDPDWIEKAKIG